MDHTHAVVLYVF